MEEILNEYILPHWPFWGSMLIFAMMGQTMKSVFTKEMAEKSAFARIFRATLQIHPVLAGLVIGWSNMLPASGGVESAGGKALYFGASGVLSSWLFYAIKRYLKKKGVDLPTGVPSMPPPKPDDDEDDDSSSNSDPPDSASDPPESSEPPADSDPPKSDSDPPASEDEDAEGGAEKRDSEPPPTRADCIAAVRPCPHVQCRHHIWNDTKAVPLPRQTCALDAAADGPLTLEEIGDLLGLTRERIRQIQVGVEAKHAVWSSLRVFHEA